MWSGGRKRDCSWRGTAADLHPDAETRQEIAMNETTPTKEKQARAVQARAADEAESAPVQQEDTPEKAAGGDPEAVKEDPSMDDDVHEAHRETVPTAPLGH